MSEEEYVCTMCMLSKNNFIWDCGVGVEFGESSRVEERGSCSLKLQHAPIVVVIVVDDYASSVSVLCLLLC